MVRTSRPPPAFVRARPVAYAPRALLASLRDLAVDEPDEVELQQRRKRIVPRLRQVIRDAPSAASHLVH